ncbi:type II toxin-antitoxin system death-on-curing family toxin [Paenibacillus tyrfis]|uniref:type II toxin-antitoxin system death-on-curing family toxin n=1 Tax=Paenibacillus tyrfis TaxID=1501230 RepID=UPI000B5900C8|nr:type II toxin-antitoxin system death-on-curing family toxin [Paenibacillus tyrfis]
MYIKLTAQQIKEIHDQELKESGGLPGIKEPGYLELLADKPFSDYFGQEQYPGLFCKAAVYFHGIATAHAFSDGNKRTAVLVTYTFLLVNGYELDADPDELFEVTIRVATKAMSLQQLEIWLERNSIRA